MRRMCERAGVKPFGYHAIRHLSASILYKSGYSVATIQAILRHKNPNTTSRYLRSLGVEEVRETMEAGFGGRAAILPFTPKKRAPGDATSESPGCPAGCPPDPKKAENL